MTRDCALKIVLLIVGLLFCTGIYPLLVMHPDPAEAMLAIVYVTLGVFLLLALRNTSAYRSLIAFTAWSSFTHGALMAVQALRHEIPRIDLLRAVLPLFTVGVLLIVLAPARTSSVEAYGGDPSPRKKSDVMVA